jgi:hypothetical protein
MAGSLTRQYNVVDDAQETLSLENGAFACLFEEAAPLLISFGW